MWWPFAKKLEVQQKGPGEWERAEAQVAALRAWRDVGQEFDYFGRRMVVVKHSRIETWPGLHFPTLHLVPELHARYADDHGELHTLVMSEAEVLALMHSLQPNAEVSGCLRAPMPEDAQRTAAGSPLDRPVGPVAGA